MCIDGHCIWPTHTHTLRQTYTHRVAIVEREKKHVESDWFSVIVYDQVHISLSRLHVHCQRWICILLLCQPQFKSNTGDADTLCAIAMHIWNFITQIKRFIYIIFPLNSIQFVYRIFFCCVWLKVIMGYVWWNSINLHSHQQIWNIKFLMV